MHELANATRQPSKLDDFVLLHAECTRNRIAVTEQEVTDIGDSRRLHVTRDGSTSRGSKSTGGWTCPRTIKRVCITIWSMHGFAMYCEIEPLALHLVRYAQPNEDVDDLEDDQRHDRVVDEDNDHACELVENLHGVALDQAGSAAIGLNRKHTGKQRAGNAAEAMHTESIERIIVSQHALETGAAPVTHGTGGSADAQRADGADEARRWRDGDEAGDGAGADPDHRRLAAHHPFYQHPYERRRGGGHVRHQHRHAGLHSCRYRRAGIEAEPA